MRSVLEGWSYVQISTFQFLTLFGSLTTLRDKLVKIGAKVVKHARYVTFQMAEVAVPRDLFAAILARIGQIQPVMGTG